MEAISGLKELILLISWNRYVENGIAQYFYRYSTAPSFWQTEIEGLSGVLKFDSDGLRTDFKLTIVGNNYN